MPSDVPKLQGSKDDTEYEMRSRAKARRVQARQGFVARITVILTCCVAFIVAVIDVGAVYKASAESRLQIEKARDEVHLKDLELDMKKRERESDTEFSQFNRFRLLETRYGNMEQALERCGRTEMWDHPPPSSPPKPAR